jgi:hypothetical protein
MSGGHFGYRQGAIVDIADSIDDEIYGNKFTDPNTVTLFQDAVKALRLAHVYANRIDWFLSGDDGEETLHKRLAHDLHRLWQSTNREELE